MNANISEAEISKLLQSDEDQLLQQLGIRKTALDRDPSIAMQLSPSITAASVSTMGGLDDLKLLGRRILRRWEQSGYELFCGGDPDDSEARKKVADALGISQAAAVAAISAALISMGLVPALAPIVAALIVRKFFAPIHEEFCKIWGERLKLRAGS